jgi:hypothetical protein
MVHDFCNNGLSRSRGRYENLRTVSQCSDKRADPTHWLAITRYIGVPNVTWTAITWRSSCLVIKFMCIALAIEMELSNCDSVNSELAGL